MDRNSNKADPVLVLAHPVVVGSLIGWLINDWVLKARFGNEITGKLSDVFAMVVFPLLIAVVAGRFSKYPLRWGLAINTVFFAAINLSTAADRLVEEALSLVVPSTLTMDATDLAVLPVMAVASHVWRRAYAPPSNARRIARRRVGRIVFAAGALTCLATSAPEETRSASHSGSFVLSAEQLALTMPLDYNLNGNRNPHLDVRMTLTAYGNGADGDLPHGTVAWNATPDELSFELTDPAWAPVHVEWNAVALGEIEDCVFWRCDADDATMTIEVPPLTSKPVADHRIELPRPADGEQSLAIITFVIDSSAPPALELRNNVGFVATVDGRRLTTRDISRTWPIPVPEKCTDACLVAIPVTYGNYGQLSFGVFGKVSSIEVETPQLVEVSTELMIPVDDLSIADRSRFRFCLRADVSETASDPFVAFSGVAIGFGVRSPPRLTSSVPDDAGCVAVGSAWIGPDEVSGHEQIIITGIIKTTEDQIPQNLEVVIIE